MPIIKKPRKHDLAFEEESASAYYLSRWRGRDVIARIPHPYEPSLRTKLLINQIAFPDPVVRAVPKARTSEQLRELAAKLCQKYPGISISERVLGGVPHIQGTRLSVAHILAHIHHSGSIAAVLDEFKQKISEDQVKEALAYSHDFMEMICDALEDDD
jgi:uncharacterized protein (DUF433 family)